MKDYFSHDGIVGALPVRRKLSFYVDNYKKSGGNRINPICFFSRFGSGKTMFARSFMDKLDKRKIEINCSTLKNTDSFYNEVYLPFIHNQPASIYFDEVSELNDKFVFLFLSLLETSQSGVNTASIGNNTIEFNLNIHTIIASGTECQKLLPAFLSRFKLINIPKPSPKDLAEIITTRLKEFEIEKEALNRLANVSRGNPRSAVLLGEDVRSYLTGNKKNSFTTDDFIEFSRQLDILPMGITNNEAELMRYLRDTGPATLTSIAASLQMTVDSVRRNVEGFLLSNGIIKIEQKRLLTHKGLKLLEEIEKASK